MTKLEIIIKDTHRGLWYEDGVLNEARVTSQRLAAQAGAEVQHLQTAAAMKRLQERERNAQAYTKHPALLRMLELETLTDLARNANARIYIGFAKHAADAEAKAND